MSTLYDSALLRFLQTSHQKPIVLVTGVFDILHHAHVAFLHAAQQLGGTLIVGVESDVRVKILKGENRPINSAQKRVEEIENIKIAHCVFILPELFSKPEHYLHL
ncbi:adenylyltransferase/cytidyltransferase family protein, partial [Candidatus Woesebacteria bacterium]|nr:adenylyltransferase/cytidyltransferase family protein [Candidatus Woesebacteria bacterium]